MLKINNLILFSFIFILFIFSIELIDSHCGVCVANKFCCGTTCCSKNNWNECCGTKCCIKNGCCGDDCCLNASCCTSRDNTVQKCCRDGTFCCFGKSVINCCNPDTDYCKDGICHKSG
uniref:Uncharacterized protein n=1 Tax=Meloidogyne enterolobii TaxID=390850 RepID=A0A6V7TY19_MELEN|nr:unnamed protein product [Meloidogyne enterolobii]